MSTTAPIVTIGNAIVDIIARAEDQFIAEQGMNKGGMQLLDMQGAAQLYDAIGPAVEISGGSAANTAVGIVSCGGKAGFIGKLAEDEMGRIFTHDITAAGVEYSPAYADGERTASCIVLVTPDAQRTMNTHLGATLHLQPGDIDPERIACADWAYLEGYLFDAPGGPDCYAHVAEIARANGTKLALSLSDAWCVDRHRTDLQSFIQDKVDLLFGNEIEIESLTGQQGDAMLSALPDLAGEVAVTLGEKGSVIVTAAGQTHIGAQDGVNVVDTTGAGDLYAGGYLYARHHGASEAEAGRIGTIAAAEIISHIGARPETPLASLI